MSPQPRKQDFSLGDYITVAERISNFHAEYPDGSLQQVKWEVREVGDRTFIVYTAAAYRNADDLRPGIGTAWETFPGHTSFTKDSELMNAETAAWGRAIVALGLTSNRQIASREEMEGKRDTPPPLVDDRANELREEIRGLYAEIRKTAGGTKALPPGRFNTKLRRVEVIDHAAMEELRDELASMLEHLKKSEEA